MDSMDVGGEAACAKSGLVEERTNSAVAAATSANMREKLRRSM